MRRATWLFLIGAVLRAQHPQPQEPVQGIAGLFATYRIVMLGEIHGCRQQYEVLSRLVANPAFGDRVNDIVVEFGNAKYQQLVDRYTAGENVPFEQVQKAWRDTVGALGPVSPIYGEFYKAVRDANRKLPAQRKLRIVLGDPPIDWEQVRSREDVGLYLPFRDEFYASVVRYEVLARRHKALLIMGEGHFRRNGGRPGAIEYELLMAFVKPYVIVPGSDTVRGYDDVDPRFAAIAAPALIEMKGNWIGSLPAPARGGAAATWDQTADAYLYLGPRDRLTLLKNRRSDLDGTAYGRELQRRLAILFDKPPDFLPKSDRETEQPAFSRTPAPPPPLPAPPKPHP
ncbi:MAG TPA: hypothetical protein VMT86_04550 [Bryobacteraceae bacterium]|nr:hypothetical protein [Bryobacteraceae bacterium]